MAIYPTWNRFLNLWKTVVYPVIKQNVHVIGYEQVTSDENFVITIEEPISEDLLCDIIDKIKYALEAKGYTVDKWDRHEDCDLTIQGKNRDLWEPCIDISVFEDELDDSLIMEWDDERWNDAGTGFREDYLQWLADNNVTDKYEDLWKAPRKVRELYCEWVRANSTDNKFWVHIMPCNM